MSSSKNLMNRVSSRFSKSSKSSSSDARDSSAKSTSSSIFSSSRTSLSKESKWKSAEALQSVSEQKSLGLTVLSEGEGEVVVDIVAIHGLNGHSERTWTAENDVFWLRDLLPRDIPNARIMTYGYNVDVFDKGGHGLDQQHVYDHARGLVGDLVLERQLTETGRRPIIFIAHSLGGIVVKAALIHSDSCRVGSLESHHSIAVSTHGIFFMGTPHQGGSGVALGRALVNIASVFVRADSRILSDLERDSQLLHTQLGLYNAISSSYVTKFAYETLETPTLFGNSIMVVPISSAVVPGAVDAEPIAINANHRDMVRFTGREDGGYKKVQGHLRIMIKAAVKNAEENWRIDDGKKRVQSGEIKKTAIIRLKDISNSFFVGRARELELLHQYLTTANNVTQRRVVIFGVGGSGKTEIALNYALQHTTEYSAIFFVNAKEMQTLRADYVDIARHLDLTEALPLGDADVAKDVAKQDAAIAAVKQWFVEQEGGWLLIFDNADEVDGLTVQEFIPPTRKGHVILTSQDRRKASLGSSIEVEDMVQEDAETLFLERAKIKEPAKEQKETCKVIVNRLGRLALAVEHAGAYVHDNDMAQRLNDYLVDLDKNRQRVLDESPEFSNHKTSVLTTYSMAKDSLKAQSIASVYLLTLLSCFDSSGVHESLLFSADVIAHFKEQGYTYPSDSKGFYESKKALLSFSLIRIHKTVDGQTVISMHNLVHQCVQAKLIQKTQWRWAREAWVILCQDSVNNTFQNASFVHLRYCLGWLLERHNDPEIAGKPEAPLYVIAPYLMFQHHNLWRQAGLMDELYQFSCMCVQGLEKETSAINQQMLAIAVLLKAGSSVYIDPRMLNDVVLRQYLEQQMCPELLKIVKRIETGSASVSDFTRKAKCLEEVFACAVGNPDLSPRIASFADEAAKGYISRNQPDLSELYFKIKRMPPNRTWKSMILAWWVLIWSYVMATWTCTPRAAAIEDQMLIAARDRKAGSMDSTFALLRQMSDDKSSLICHRAAYELIRLLVKAGRLTEAKERVSRLRVDIAKETEEETAKAFVDMYVWLRKAESVLLIKLGHENHSAAKQLLLSTLKATVKVSGSKSLSTLHAIVLLQLFYSQPCCLDEALIKEYNRQFMEVFEYLYAGTPTMMRKGEGYRMGLILLTQGALEEAAEVLKGAEISADKLLGADDELTKEIRRMAVVARKERAEEIEEERLGRVSSRWGSVIVWRDISGL